MIYDKDVAADLDRLWSLFQADPGDKETRNRLLECYLPLVRFTAERIRVRLPEGVELDDLISAGTFGLMGAIESFDPERGFKFETFCQPRIRGAILDQLRDMDWVPRMVRNRSNKMAERSKHLEAALGRRPTEQEVADAMELPLDEYLRIRTDSAGIHLLSLHKSRGESDGERELQEMDVIADRRSEDPTRRTQKQDLMRLVTKGMNRNERLIIIMYYYEQMTMKEIGSTLGLSESRVSQMHSAIVSRLQGLLGSRRGEFQNV